ncbi:TlpA disulfide reductase family protein [Massilia sp. PWRC2]|uniref:TlpA disulfide reductase family protein n=1 Tax=Massilia sp. PWRC2 TaxID=2804626 RepID=UPI003CF0F53B
MTASSATASRPWLKPAVAAVALLGALGLAYATFASKTQAPAVTFITLDGHKVSTASLHGKVVMVNFWATSCATCVKEMPQMVDTYQQFKGQGLEFVAVAMKYDPPNYVLNYTQTRQLPFKVALDSSGEIAHAFGDVALTPTTFVIGKDGTILKRYVGEPQFDELHSLLKKALAAG